MTVFILSLNYCHFSTVKVNSGNANLFMYAIIISSHFTSTTHHNASAYPQIVKTKSCSFYSKCKINLRQVISYLNLNPKFPSYLNFLHFFIVYPGISNPGPLPGNRKKDLSAFYQNEQGLIPFGSLTDQHPNLDITKICELQAYIFEKNPDIIILNETCLKPTILSSETSPNNTMYLGLTGPPSLIQSIPLTQKSLGKMEGAY